MGCGGFIVELRRVLDTLQPGNLAHICARGAGASADISAWCGMTGHLLILANHPNYIIQTKGD
jgi:TusA-related sulfurtransferase